MVAGRFGGWGQTFASPNITRVYSENHSISKALKEEEERKKKWQNYCREKELAEVSPETTRDYSNYKIEALKREEKQKKQQQNHCREKELAEVREKLGEELLDGDSVLLIIQEINTIVGMDRIQRNVVTFFDPVLTKEHGLEGTPVTITITTVNGEKQRNTKLYVVELLTAWGKRKMVRAFGMEKITKRVLYICLTGSRMCGRK